MAPEVISFIINYIINKLIHSMNIHMFNFRYDALLSQNEQLKKKIIAIDCAMKQKQKEVHLQLHSSLNYNNYEKEICIMYKKYKSFLRYVHVTYF